jgi:hypothetical protein
MDEVDEVLTPEVVALLDGLADLRESDTRAYEGTISSLKDQNPDPSQEEALPSPEKGGHQRMSSTPRGGESTYHAYLFAMKESDPEAYSQQMERTAAELKGEMLGSAMLEAHKAQQERKRQQRERSFDFIARNRLGK